MDFFMFLPLSLASALPPVLLGFLIVFFALRGPLRLALANQQKVLAFLLAWFTVGILQGLGLCPEQPLLTVLLSCGVALIVLFLFSRMAPQVAEKKEETS